MFESVAFDLLLVFGFNIGKPKGQGRQTSKIRRQKESGNMVFLHTYNTQNNRIALLQVTQRTQPSHFCCDDSIAWTCANRWSKIRVHPGVSGLYFSIGNLCPRLIYSAARSSSVYRCCNRSSLFTTPLWYGIMTHNKRRRITGTNEKNRLLAFNIVLKIYIDRWIRPFSIAKIMNWDG